MTPHVTPDPATWDWPSLDTILTNPPPLDTAPDYAGRNLTERLEQARAIAVDLESRLADALDQLVEQGRALTRARADLSIARTQTAKADARAAVFEQELARLKAGPRAVAARVPVQGGTPAKPCGCVRTCWHDLTPPAPDRQP